MSQRHWLRDVIDFSDMPHRSSAVTSVAPRERCRSACAYCNRAAQEIADSLALDGCECFDLGGFVEMAARSPRLRDAMARTNARMVQP